MNFISRNDMQKWCRLPSGAQSGNWRDQTPYGRLTLWGDQKVAIRDGMLF